MRRALSGIVLLGLGCVRASQPTTPPTTIVLTGLPEATRPAPEPLAWNEVRLIEQLEPPRPEYWRFDPRSTRIAAAIGGCGVWEDSGFFLGFADDSLPERPCETWPAAIPVPGSAAHTTHPPAGLRRRHAPGDTYLATAFSQDRLALMVATRSREIRVEIWDSESRLVAEYPLAEVDEFEQVDDAHGRLLWSDDSLLAIVEQRESGIDLLVWSRARDEPWTTNIRDEFESAGELLIDPQWRWLLVQTRVAHPRSESYLRLDIHPLGPDSPDVGLAWEEDERDPLDYLHADGSAELDALGWRGEVGSTYSWRTTSWNIDSEDQDDLFLEWRTASLRVQPSGHVEFDMVDDLDSISDVSEYRLRERLIAGTLVLVDEDVCTVPELEYHDEVEPPPPAPVCESTRAAPQGCELVDASWQLDDVLLACADRWQLVGVDEASLVLDEARELARSREARVAWSRSQLALWTPDAGLRRHRGPSWSEVDHAPELELLRATLDEEVELLLVRAAGVVHVLDLRGDTLGPALEWTGAIEHAAFSPDGRMLALAGEGRIATFLRDRGTPLVRIESGELAGLAFRQDSRVLFVGVERLLPELALDPTSGGLVSDAQLDREAFSRIADAELDPSWRWAIEEDGTFLRTLDGQALKMRDDAALLESGWVAGRVEGWTEYGIQIGPRALEHVYSLREVAEQWLLRPNLVSEFFDGKPLRRPWVERPIGDPRPNP